MGYCMLTALLLTAVTIARGQFALEHVYPGGSYTSTPNFESPNQLFLLELEASGWKYVRVDRNTRQVYFYHLDHSFWKSISFTMTAMLNSYAPAQDILYISEHLFDLDDGIEFMYVNVLVQPFGPSQCVTQVVDEETAALLFSVSGQYPAVKVNFHMQQFPIRSTPSGTKLILSSIVSDSAYVYGLAGEWPTDMAPILGQANAVETMQLFPNPGSSELTIVLPAGRSSSTIELISSTGQVVQRVDAMGAKAVIDIRGLASGHYVCRVQSTDGGACIGTFLKE